MKKKVAELVAANHALGVQVCRFQVLRGPDVNEGQQLASL
jgi:hypothetical protein